MHHFVTEISVTKWCIVGYGTGALRDLCNRFIRVACLPHPATPPPTPHFQGHQKFVSELWFDLTIWHDMWNHIANPSNTLSANIQSGMITEICLDDTHPETYYNTSFHIAIVRSGQKIKTYSIIGTLDLCKWSVEKVSRLRLCKMRVLKYYVENKALFETW